MDERKKSVLKAIVVDYVNNAEPVGSRTIARKYVLGVSPATIRNEMADLEELGYLQQPHTSAGRIPSDKGYRFYVDNLMTPVEIPVEVLERLRTLHNRRAREVEWLIHETARILSDITQYASVLVGPGPGRRTLESLQAIRGGEGRAVLVLITTDGLVHHRLIDLPEEIDFQRLALSLQTLSEVWRGRSLGSLSLEALRESARERYLRPRLIEEIADFLASALSAAEERKVFLGGASNILRQPEFRDVGKVRELFGLFEEEEELRRLLSDEETGVTVHIGVENRAEAIRDCGLVTATYRWGDDNLGQIGVLGPKRMDYAKVMAVVEAVAESLTQSLRG